MFAENYPNSLKAFSISLSLACLLSGNMYSYSLPKEIMLKKHYEGRDLRKKTSASFAILILLPDIEPLRSRMKMNSPRAASMSALKFVDFMAAN